MKTGIPRRAAVSQTTSSSGSSSWRRVPSALRVVSPNCLPISPMPTAPARTSSSSWAAMRTPEPGPTSRRSSVVKNTKRSACPAARTASICRVRRLPELPRACTMTWRFRSSIAATTRSIVAGSASDGGCPWKSTAGYFARGTGFSGTTRVERGRYSTMLGGGRVGCAKLGRRPCAASAAGRRSSAAIGAVRRMVALRRGRIGHTGRDADCVPGAETVDRDACRNLGRGAGAGHASRRNQREHVPRAGDGVPCWRVSGIRAARLGRGSPRGRVAMSR